METVKPPPQDVEKNVEAQAFRLRDQEGRVRAELGLEVEGRPFLRFKDEEGKVRIELGLDTWAAANLLLHDPDGKVKVQLSVDADGIPRLAMEALCARFQVEFFGDGCKAVLENDLAGSIGLNVKEGKVVGPTVMEGGMVGLTMANKDGKTGLWSRDGGLHVSQNSEVTKKGE